MTGSSMSQMETESSMYCHHGSNGDVRECMAQIETGSIMHYEFKDAHNSNRDSVSLSDWHLVSELSSLTEMSAALASYQM
jgi:hypothetical protein